MDTSSSEEDVGYTKRSPFEVILRGGTPWGFHLKGGAGEGSPLEVCQIATRGKAHLCRLVEGDIILSINGISCSSREEAGQLIESAFRTLTLKVWRGNYESSQSRPPSYPGKLSVEYRSDDSVHIQDDSALYKQSKSSQSQGRMKPRQRRGESFNVPKQNRREREERREERRSHDPPRQPSQQRETKGQGYQGSPGYHGHQDHIRRYSGADPRDAALSPGVSRSGQLVSAKSTPALHQDLPSPSGYPGYAPSISPAKSSPNIPEDIGQDHRSHGNTSRANRHDIRSSDYAKQPPSPNSAYSMYRDRDHLYQKPRPNMYTNDDPYGEAKQSDKYSRRSMPPHLGRYQADYENIASFGTSPLQSEKISEIEDDEADMEGPISQPRYKNEHLDYQSSAPPVPPVRDPSSLHYGRYNQAHEKYPSWPVTKQNEVGETGQPITARAQSWTDHTNSKKEVPTGGKPRYLHNPSLRPVFEKGPQSDKKEDGKSARNQSDPGFTREFGYDKYGRVVQKNYENIGKNKFEDLINSEPGYPPPKFDSDGHNYGDKEYNVPSPPERDIPGVDQDELNDKLTSSQTSVSSYQSPSFSSQFEKDSKTQKFESLDSGTSPLHSPVEDVRAPFNMRSHRDKSAKEKTLVDSSTSPLQSPKDNKNPPKFGAPRDQPSAQLQQTKAYIVKQTPYYNTSTQTDGSSYAIKTSLRSADPKQCNAETQANEVSGQTPNKGLEDRANLRQKHDMNTQDRGVGEKGKFSFSSSSLMDKPKFEGFESIQSKYAADDFPDEEEDQQKSKEVVVPHYSEYDPSTQSMLRSLTREYYGGHLPHPAEKRLSSASSHDTSHHGMREAGSYSSIASVVIHASENSGPFGRDEFGSKSSLSDSRGDTSSVSESMSSRSSMPRGRYSLDPSMLSNKSRHLFSSVTHQKSSSFAENQRRPQHSSSGYRPASYHSSDSSTPSQPKSSTDTRTSGSTQYEDSPTSHPPEHESRLDSYNDSVFTNDERSPLPREGEGQSKTDSKVNLGRQPSMKKAYGIYDETEGEFRGKEGRSGLHTATDYVQMNHPNNRGSRSDVKHMDQIQEEGDNSSSKQRTSGSLQDSIYDSKYPRTSDWRTTRDKWKEETKRSSLKRTTSEQITHVRDKGSFSDNEKVVRDSDRGSVKQTDRSLRDSERSQRDSDRLPSDRSVRDSDRSLCDSERSLRDNERSLRDSERSLRESERGSLSNLDRTSQRESERGSQSNFEKGSQRDRERGSLRDLNDRGSLRESEQGSVRDSERGSFKDSVSSVGSGRESKSSYRDDKVMDGDRKVQEDNNAYRERSGSGKVIEKQRTQSVDEGTSDQINHTHSVSEDQDLKKRQQMAVFNFMQMKTGKNSTGNLSEDSADMSNLYEYVPGSSPIESVTDLINKASENLNASKAHRADSLRRSGSSASSRHSSDYIDMARQRKETEWSRLRSQGSFTYSPDLNRSNRSSLCSDHQYEDISMFSPSTPRNSYPGSIKEDVETRSGETAREKNQGLPSSTSMDSALTASPTYQNLYTPRRPPPPPPPRSPSPEDKPPALPPRNYRRHSEGHVLSKQRPMTLDHDPLKLDDSIDRTKRDFRDLKSQFENSPREDAYIEKLRLESRRRMSAQPMVIKYSKPNININFSTTTKREQMVPQEATSPSNENTQQNSAKISPIEESNKENSAPSQAPPNNPRERTLSDIPPPSPPKVEGELASDAEELPPPPPDLLPKEEEDDQDKYADDSYMSAAVRRSRRNSGTGNYKRSASAAALRPGEDDSANDTDANSVFLEAKKLGHQTWNSESALSRHSVGGSLGRDTVPNYPGTLPGNSATLPGNVIAFKAGVETVSVTRGTVQPLQPQVSQPLQPQLAQSLHPSSPQHAQNFNTQTQHSSSAQHVQLVNPPSIQHAQAVHPQQPQHAQQPPPTAQHSHHHPPQTQHSLSVPKKPARPPQTLSTSALPSSSRSQIHSPTSSSSTRSASQLTVSSSVSARTVPSPTTPTGAGGTFITPVVKPVQSPSSGGQKHHVPPAGSSSQSPAAMTKTSLFSPRPFVSHHSQGGEDKEKGSSSSVRDRISRLESSGSRPVRSPRFEPNKVSSPKHTTPSTSSSSLKPVDSSWKTNPDQIRTSSPKTVGGGNLKADSSWETLENLSHNIALKVPPSVSQANSQNSQRILESWRDDRSRYPRNESFSSSSSNSTVSSSEKRPSVQDNFTRSNYNDKPANSATSLLHQAYRHSSQSEQSVANRGQISHSAYNQRESRRHQNSAQRTDSSSGGANQRVSMGDQRQSMGESHPVSPAYRERRPREYKSREQDTNGVHLDGESFSPSERISNQHKNRSVSPRESFKNNNNLGNMERLDISRTQDNRYDNSSTSQLDKSSDQKQANKHDTMETPIHHGRQRSQEEIECDEQAKQLAMELEGSDKKLSEVLTHDPNRMKFLDGMFTDPALELNRRPSSGKVSPRGDNSHERKDSDDGENKGIPAMSYFKGPSKARVEMECRRNEEVNKDLIKDLQDNDALKKQKEELMEKLYAKLKVLKEEKVMLQQEIDENEALGKKVCESVERQARTQTEKDKFTRFLDELEKIVRLMLNLSGQLARAENAVQSLGQNTDAKIKKLTIDKRERLNAKYQDAKGLKQDIDERSESVATMLQHFLSEDEFEDYHYFIKMKSKLTIDCQDLDDKITLGEEQIQELKKSIPDN